MSCIAAQRFVESAKSKPIDVFIKHYVMIVTLPYYALGAVRASVRCRTDLLLFNFGFHVTAATTRGEYHPVLGTDGMSDDDEVLDPLIR